MLRKSWCATAIVIVSAGAMFLSLGGCPAESLPTGLTGAALAGENTFIGRCQSCHAVSDMRGASLAVVNNMGNVANEMRDITLTNDEVANIKAFIAAL